MSATLDPWHGRAQIDPECIFCKIVAGQIPSYKLLEDERVFCFLDIGPLSSGHSLVIPKDHYQSIDQLPDELAAACAAVIPRLSRAIMAVTGTSAWNVLQNNGRVAGQLVDHVHFHIIPRRPDDGLGFRWPAGKLDSHEAAQLIQAITTQLDQSSQ